LILVAGAPASGKTTLARRLAADLALPLLARDTIKEALFDSLGAPDRERSRELGVASYAVLYALLTSLLAAGPGLVLESNFHHGLAEEALRPIVAAARAALVYCEAARAETIRRYVARFERGERHPGHHDAAALPEIAANLDAGVYAPLALAIPTLRVDTTHGYAPDLPAITAFIAAATTEA